MLISIDSVNLFELFRPYRRKIYFSLEFSKARKFYWLIYLYRFVFDCLFEWELNACGASRSFLPFFPSRVGLLHDVSGIVSTVNPLDFYSTQDFLSLKIRDLSVVVSNKSFLPWQFLRLELLDQLSSTSITVFAGKMISIIQKRIRFVINGEETTAKSIKRNGARQPVD